MQNHEKDARAVEGREGRGARGFVAAAGRAPVHEVDTAPDGTSYRESHLDRADTYDATLSASAFDAYISRWEARHAIDIVRQLFPGGVPRYLDFACGTGRMTQSIAPLAKETVGIDVSTTMLAAARRKVPGARFVEVDLTLTDADVGSFDLVTAFRFFGNAEPQLRVAAAAALYRVLRPGGYLLANNHRNRWAMANVLAVVSGAPQRMDLTHWKLRRLLTNAGFDIVEARPIAAWQFRSRLMNSTVLDARREGRLERAFRSGWWAPIAPDEILLARKTRSRSAEV